MTSHVDRHVSRQEGAAFIGTDPDEWWEGFEALREAMGGMLQIVPGQIRGIQWERGGWRMEAR